MILAIDPDLFKASETDYACALMLAKILEKVCEDNIFKYRFALDGKDIEKEYWDYYIENLETGKRDNPAFLLLDCIFRNSNFRGIAVPPELSEDVQVLIDRYDCTTPVEPQLIGMAYYSRNLGGMHLLLAGSGVAGGREPLRRRGLYDKKTLEAFSKVLDSVKICFVNTAVSVELSCLDKDASQKEACPKKSDDSKLEIFLHYAQPEDEIEARKLYEKLKEDGYSPWFDQKSLLPGQKRTLEVKQRIKTADLFIILLSAKANKKRGKYQKEMDLIVDRCSEFPENEDPLIPVNLDGCDIPEKLEDLVCADFSENRESGFKRLLVAIKTNHSKKLETQKILSSRKL